MARTGSPSTIIQNTRGPLSARDCSCPAVLILMRQMRWVDAWPAVLILMRQMQWVDAWPAVLILTRQMRWVDAWPPVCVHLLAALYFSLTRC